MSSITKNLFIGGAAVIFGFYAATVVVDQYKMKRNVSSSGEKSLSSYTRTIKPLGKPGSAFLVKVSPLSQLPDEAENDLVLRAEVHLGQAVDGEVHFKWILPDDVSLVDGDLEDSWADLKPGQVATSEITVYGIGKNISKVIHFEVSSSSGGKNLGASGIFSTRPEDLTLSYEQDLESDSKDKSNSFKVKSKEAPKGLPRGVHL